MPEGHTIHRLALDHTKELAGKRVRVASPQGRFEGAELIDDARFSHADAWGKHLFHHWVDGHVVHVHLGLFGRFFRFVRKAPPPRETTRMRLAAEGGPTFDLVGPTACALIDRKELRALLARLGPDPLREDAEPLRRGVRDKRIITVDEAVHGRGSREEAGQTARGRRQRLSRAERLHIYKASRCPRCQGPVRRWDLSGRWAYACEKCQR